MNEFVITWFCTNQAENGSGQKEKARDSIKPMAESALHGLAQIARQRAKEETANGGPADDIQFYEDFASKLEEYQQYD